MPSSLLPWAVDLDKRMNAGHDVSVRSVHHANDRDAWQIILEHPSFEEVDEGCLIPEYDHGRAFYVEHIAR